MVSLFERKGSFRGSSRKEDEDDFIHSVYTHTHKKSLFLPRPNFTSEYILPFLYRVEYRSGPAPCYQLLSLPCIKLLNNLSLYVGAFLNFDNPFLPVLSRVKRNLFFVNKSFGFITHKNVNSIELQLALSRRHHRRKE